MFRQIHELKNAIIFSISILGIYNRGILLVLLSIDVNTVAQHPVHLPMTVITVITLSILASRCLLPAKLTFPLNVVIHV